MRSAALVFAVTLAVAGCSLGQASREAPGGASSGAAGSSTSGTAGAGPSTGSAGGPAGTGTGQAGSTGAAGTTTVVSPPGSAGGTGAAGASGAAGVTGGITTGAAGAATPPDGGASDAGGGDASTGCVVTITRLDPATNAPLPLSGLEAGSSSTLRLQASAAGPAFAAEGGAPRWMWSVKIAGSFSLADLPLTPVGEAGDTVDLPLAMPGSYKLQASVQGAPGCYSASIVVEVKQPKDPSYRFRVTPPSASQLPVTELLVPAAAIAEGPRTLDLGDVKSREVVSLAPLDTRGFPVPSYLRISSSSFSFDLEGYTGRGALIAPLATSLTYDVLIVPDGGLAPLLVSGTPDAVSNRMSIGPGVAVTGSMRDGYGQAVAGARLVLRAGARPSTIAVSAADGSFTLSTREGTMAAEVLAPAGSGLPDAHVAASPGVVLLPDTNSLALSMTWAKLATAPLTVTVKTNGAVVAGARVRADLATALPNVGTLEVGGLTPAHLTAWGTAHADGVTDAQGVVHLGSLPTGSYHLVVAPPEDIASVAITLADVVLAGAGVSMPIALAAPVTFSGTLLPLGSTPAAKVTAIDRGVFASATLPTTRVGPDGTYALSLAAGRSYELLVEPTAGSMLGRAVVDVVTPNAGGGSRTSAVPPALSFRGSVGAGGRVVAGARVEVFCAVPVESCLDATLALAQGTTAADGTVTLTLPGPPSSP